MLAGAKVSCIQFRVKTKSYATERIFKNTGSPYFVQHSPNKSFVFAVWTLNDHLLIVKLRENFVFRKYRSKFVCKIPLLARRTRPKGQARRATIEYFVYKKQVSKSAVKETTF